MAHAEPIARVSFLLPGVCVRSIRASSPSQPKPHAPSRPARPGMAGAATTPSSRATAAEPAHVEASTPVPQPPVPQPPVPQAPVPQAPVPQAPVPQAPVPQDIPAVTTSSLAEGEPSAGATSTLGEHQHPTGHDVSSHPADRTEADPATDHGRPSSTETPAQLLTDSPAAAAPSATSTTDSVPPENVDVPASAAPPAGLGGETIKPAATGSPAPSHERPGRPPRPSAAPKPKALSTPTLNLTAPAAPSPEAPSPVAPPHANGEARASTAVGQDPKEADSVPRRPPRPTPAKRPGSTVGMRVPGASPTPAHGPVSASNVEGLERDASSPAAAAGEDTGDASAVAAPPRRKAAAGSGERPVRPPRPTSTSLNTSGASDGNGKATTDAAIDA
jgi:hypothetical protein